MVNKAVLKMLQEIFKKIKRTKKTRMTLVTCQSFIVEQIKEDDGDS